MKQKNRRGIACRASGVVALAMLVVACSGSSDSAESEGSTPASEVSSAPVTDPLPTVAPVVTDPPAEEPAVEATEIPDLPCADYIEESGYPLTPCDSGTLVETLQRDLESLFPSIAIDGLFGNQTFGFIKEFQTSEGVEATGLVSEELADQIATAESLGEAGSDDEAASDEAAADGAAAGDDEAATDAPDGEADAADTATEELCNDLIGKPDDPNFDAQQIEDCSAIGVDIVGEG